MTELGGWLLACLFAWLYWRTRRQVRALHYCYVNMSDWAIGKLDEEREYSIRTHGEHVTSFSLLEAHDEWKNRVRLDADMLKRAKVSVSTDNHINYIMEDLGR